MRLEILVLALTGVIAPLAALSGAQASAAGPWLMVVPPWVDAEALARDAGARLIGPSRAPLGQLVAPETSDATAAAVAAQRLGAGGAWFVFDAGAALELCGET